MDLNCLKDIVFDNLAIYIDITNIKSWNLNTGLTVNSLTKWKNSYSDNIELLDFGLTAFDIGKTNIMWSGITLTPDDVIFNMSPIGYNIIENPTTEEYSGVTVETEILPLSGITVTGETGNYFSLNGGYLSGFFKLENYNYELLSNRYNKGLTIETILNLYPDSHGIFYLMGLRAEDKYNPFFSGESKVLNNNNVIDGVYTSEDDYLEGIVSTKKLNAGFGDYLNMYSTINVELENSGNTINNIVAFEITEDKRIGYKYIDKKNIVRYNYTSPNIIPISGWTMIDILFKPYDVYDESIDITCLPQRLGDLKIYVNGRFKWKFKDFPEIMFHGVNNDKEKQITVPYNINWGGGSFGLKHSYHYDYQTYDLYTGQTTEYINNNYITESNPLDLECPAYPPFTELNDLSFSANSDTFFVIDECTGDVTDITVMDIQYTGNTSGNTTGNNYFIKFNQPISVLSNRNYVVNATIVNDGFFRNYVQNFLLNNKISLIVYGSEDINIIDETYFENSYITEGETLDLNLKFNVKENTGLQTVYMGILVETNYDFNHNEPLYLFDFNYTGQDILVKDERKNNLLIEENFNSSINCDLQKLRVYDVALSSNEILHNAKIESGKNPFLSVMKNGGRIIYR